MGDSWRKALGAGRCLVLDGGSGSELARRGAPLRSHDVWSGLAPLTHAGLLREIHRDYIAAGADVITTSTFGTIRFVLEAAGHGDDFVRINERAIEAARTARDASTRDGVAIAGSISCLPPRFDLHAYPPPAAETAAYRELAELFASRGVDLLVLEMMQDTEHAARACEAAVATGLPFWLGVSGRLAPDGATLVTYDFTDRPLASVLDALLPYGPAAVCAMHSPAEAIAPMLDAIRARFAGTVGAYPEWPPEGAPPGPSSRTLASYAREWRERGARVLGGCCGTTPEDIREVAEALRTA